jgi:copper transporter 1
MLWNWTTLDTCFLTRTWHVSTLPTFFLSCLAIFALALGLELLRRLIKDHERYLRERRVRAAEDEEERVGVDVGEDGMGRPLIAKTGEIGEGKAGWGTSGMGREKVYRQAARAGLHTVQVALAYVVML